MKVYAIHAQIPSLRSFSAPTVIPAATPSERKASKRYKFMNRAKIGEQKEGVNYRSGDSIPATENWPKTR